MRARRAAVTGCPPVWNRCACRACSCCACRRLRSTSRSAKSSSDCSRWRQFAKFIFDSVQRLVARCAMLPGVGQPLVDLDQLFAAQDQEWSFGSAVGSSPSTEVRRSRCPQARRMRARKVVPGISGSSDSSSGRSSGAKAASSASTRLARGRSSRISLRVICRISEPARIRRPLLAAGRAPLEAVRRQTVDTRMHDRIQRR